jgi:hypothetical protein
MIALNAGGQEISEEDNPDIFGSLYGDEVTLEGDSVATGTSESVEEESAVAEEGFKIAARSYIKQDVEDIHLKDQLDYVVEVSWEGRLGDVAVEGPGELELIGLREVYQIPSNRTNPEENSAIAEFNYILEPLEKGEAAIGSVRVKYRVRSTGEEGVLRTGGIDLNVLGARVNWAKIISSYGMVFGLLVLGFGCVILVRKFFRRREPVGVEEKEETLCEKMRKEVDLVKVMLVEGDIREFYDRVFELARGAISVGGGGNSLRKKTSEEVRRYVEESEMEERVRGKAMTILERCDAVRYGGYVPTYGENEEILKDLTTFIDMQSKLETNSGGKRDES